MGYIVVWKWGSERTTHVKALHNGEGAPHNLTCVLIRTNTWAPDPGYEKKASGNLRTATMNSEGCSLPGFPSLPPHPTTSEKLCCDKVEAELTQSPIIAPQHPSSHEISTS